MQTKNTTRRAVLAGIATAPALAAPALALSGPDPIFAAIEQHKVAFRISQEAVVSEVARSISKGLQDTIPLCARRP